MQTNNETNQSGGKIIVVAKDGIVTTANGITLQPQIPMIIANKSRQWLFVYTSKATPCVGFFRRPYKESLLTGYC